jgi:hypothetical protein
VKVKNQVFSGEGAANIWRGGGIMTRNYGQLPLEAPGVQATAGPVGFEDFFEQLQFFGDSSLMAARDADTPLEQLARALDLFDRSGM